MSEDLIRLPKLKECMTEVDLRYHYRIETDDDSLTISLRDMKSIIEWLDQIVKRYEVLDAKMKISVKDKKIILKGFVMENLR